MLDFVCEVFDSCCVIVEIFDLVFFDINFVFLVRLVNYIGSDSIYKVVVDELELEFDWYYNLVVLDLIFLVLFDIGYLSLDLMVDFVDDYIDYD